MDIGSGKGYPESALSNFAPHPFIFRGVNCNSMEGLLQSFKFSNPEMWRVNQLLYWDGQSIDRHSDEYQELFSTY